MPRKGPAPKRDRASDQVFHSKLAARFINNLIRGGKKSKAEKIFYGALQEIGEASGRNPLDIFAQAVRNCMPMVEVRGRRVGGANIQVPVEVRADRQVALGIRWLIQAARQRGEKTMMRKLANELMDAANRQGNAVRRREEMHRMAEANKAFAHYRW
ncbi:MAG: 30S ribosomal protein S7 [Armatimonadota bacterium]